MGTVTGHLPALELRDLPEPPRSTWRVIGPGVVGAGVGLASGEFIRRALPAPIRVRSYRIAALVWSARLFGVFSALTIWQQGGELLDWLR